MKKKLYSVAFVACGNIFKHLVPPKKKQERDAPTQKCVAKKAKRRECRQLERLIFRQVVAYTLITKLPNRK